MNRQNYVGGQADFNQVSNVVTGNFNNYDLTTASNGENLGFGVNSTLTTQQSCTTPLQSYNYYPYFQYPYYQYPTYIYTNSPVTPVSDFSLRKVENGWVLEKDGKQFVFAKMEALTKFIAEFYAEKKGMESKK